MEVALYDPGVGFFATGGGAGREGDFITSPEVGPLFGTVIGSALDTWWAELGRPDPFVVVEAGAGSGTLAAAVRTAAPACAPALHYVMVERSEPLRARQSAALPLEPPSGGLGTAGDDDDHDDDDDPAVLARSRRSGPTFTSLVELPSGPVTGIVMANELLDNLPFRLLQRRDGWDEVRVGEGDGGLVEVLVRAAPELADEAEALAPDAPEGARIPVQLTARAWLTQALSLLERGRVVVIDYAGSTPSLAARPQQEWLRTYRSHNRGGLPLESAGAQDVTCEVAVDQLAKVGPPDSDRSQAEFLGAHGIDELAAAARTTWHGRAHIGDLGALKARSRVGEAAALTDPTGLGAFRVLEWTAR